MSVGPSSAAACGSPVLGTDASTGSVVNPRSLFSYQLTGRTLPYPDNFRLLSCKFLIHVAAQQLSGLLKLDFGSDSCDGLQPKQAPAPHYFMCFSGNLLGRNNLCETCCAATETGRAIDADRAARFLSHSTHSRSRVRNAERDAMMVAAIARRTPRNAGMLAGNRYQDEGSASPTVRPHSIRGHTSHQPG
jgi:hypothetical protein